MAQLKTTIIQGDLGISGNIVASKIIKSGGTADKILLANGDLLSVPTAGLGTVTSVTVSSDHFTITGSPITTSGTIKINHPTKTATTADIYKVGMDGLGHVVLGNKITPADLGLSTVYKYRGTKTWAELLALTKAEVGDVYSITNEDPEGNTNADWACHIAVTAACTAENYANYWQSLGGKVDLSAYVTGSGTVNYIPKFTATGAIGDSVISQADSNKTTVGGKLVVNAGADKSTGNCDEGIRVLPASGWAEVFLSNDTNITGTGGWLIARRGSAGTTSGAVGDFTIEYGGWQGNGLTLYANGSRPRWKNNELAYKGDVSDKTITLTAGNGLTDGGAFTLNQASDETITFNVGAGEGITVNANDVAHSVPTGASATSYGPSDGGTQTAKGTLDIIVPQITTDKFGHITSVTNKTFKVLDTDTDSDTGATSVETTGDGNAVTTASYDASTRKLTLTKGNTFVDLSSTQTITGGKYFNSTVQVLSESFKLHVGGSNKNDSWFLFTDDDSNKNVAFGIRRPYESYGFQIRERGYESTDVYKDIIRYRETGRSNPTANTIPRWEKKGELKSTSVTIDDSNNITAAKFITSGSSDQYVVLGDGKTKPLSEFGIGSGGTIDLSGYLPLTAGSGKALTGDLYIQNSTTTKNIFIGNGARIRVNDGGSMVISAKGSGQGIYLRPGGDTASTTSAAMVEGCFRPEANKGASLGNSSNQWNDIYGTTIYQGGTKVSVEGHGHTNMVTGSGLTANALVRGNGSSTIKTSTATLDDSGNMAAKSYKVDNAVTMEYDSGLKALKFVFA